MHVVDLALKADAPLPAPLIEHLIEKARATGDHRKLRALTDRGDLPEELRRRLGVQRTAAAVAAEVRHRQLTDTHIDQILADEPRVVVLAAVAERERLTAGHLRALAAADEPTIAYAIASRSDLDLSDADLARTLAATLRAALDEGRSRPGRTDIVKVLAGRLAGSSLALDPPPLAVLAAIRPHGLDSDDQSRWLAAVEDQVRSGIDQPRPGAELNEACQTLASAIRFDRVPGGVETAQRLVAAGDPAQVPALRHLRIELDRRRLLGDDPEHAAVTASGEMLDELWHYATGSRLHVPYGTEVLRGLVRNRRVGDERIPELVERLGDSHLYDLAVTVDRDGLTARAVDLATRLDEDHRLRLLHHAGGLGLSRTMTVALLDRLIDPGDGPSRTPMGAAKLVTAAAEVGRLGHVPVAVITAALRQRDRGPRVAHALVTWLHERLDVAAWPTVWAMVDTFTGTLDQLTEACAALEPTA